MLSNAASLLPSLSAWAVLQAGAVTVTTVIVAAVLALLLAGPKLRSEAAGALTDLLEYWVAFVSYLRGARYDDCPVLQGRQRARVHVFALALVFRLWDRPHYRNGTFRDDMAKNLRNVAIPGTGVPLSVLATSQWLTAAFLLLGAPLVILAGAVAEAWRSDSALSGLRMFRQQLLEPDDWMNYWLLNCRLATYYSSVVGRKGHGFEQEDKLTFLDEARRHNIPVTPLLKIDGIVCKHRNEEGGLGFHAFSSATSGGDWIIQPRLSNDRFVSSLLPKDAPLSTFRVITMSRLGLDAIPTSSPAQPLQAEQAASAINDLDDAGSKGSSSSSSSSADEDDDAADRKVMEEPDDEAAAELPRAASTAAADGDVVALSCVFRAGRSGASTDHNSVLFDVSINTGDINRGATNQHWYQVGLSKALSCPWSSDVAFSTHPDTDEPVQGRMVKSIAEIRALVERAHRSMCPHVPMVGWDVALTREHGMVLLEHNLSCNFFMASWDKPAYIGVVEEYMRRLDHADRLQC